MFLLLAHVFNRKPDIHLPGSSVEFIALFHFVVGESQARSAFKAVTKATPGGFLGTGMGDIYLDVLWVILRQGNFPLRVALLSPGFFLLFSPSPSPFPSLQNCGLRETLDKRIPGRMFNIKGFELLSRHQI